MCVLLVTAAAVLFLATGAGGAAAMSANRATRWSRRSATSTMAKIVNYIGLAGLIASFFSIIYAYSRQLFALSRAGYLPTVLSVTNSRKAPTLALIVPGVIGFALSLTGQGAMLLNMAVFGAALSLRADDGQPHRAAGARTGHAASVPHPGRHRHHRRLRWSSPALAVIATFLVDSTAALWCLAVFAAFMVYFALYSRHHLVANSPDEEFAVLAAAEEELE